MQQPRTTQKTAEVLAAAQADAAGRGHPELTPLHVAAALLAKPEGVSAAVLERLGAVPAAIAARFGTELDKLPKTQGSQLGACLLYTSPSPRDS